MKTSLLILPIAALASGCLETEGSYGTGRNSSGGTASASVNDRSGGGFTLVLSAGGSTCTGIFDDPAPGGKELSPLNCSGGNSGNATVLYDGNGRPERVVFGGVGIGSGSIEF
ncbi:hypothetical protein [Poseidonocella sp. HB161398]|uniref:hypothetical protein n=1 Tax=Poseidonocella sp. HB161398 TaxID=2320855 RepID=UPI001109C8C5|nr:hypothetical protein [Poseidonocella sp. HB161398]